MRPEDSPPAPVHLYSRRGPYLAVSSTHWVDVRGITGATETSPAGEPTRVVLDTAGRQCVTLYRPLGEVIEALAEAQLAHRREIAYEEEVGRLMALDSAGVPDGEEPPQGPPGPAFRDTVDRPFG